MEDYKEKYEQAMLRMNKWVEGSACSLIIKPKEVAEFVFPELKENDDERIRKELYDFCIKCSHGETIVNQKADFQRWVSWLEKKGEQKPADKVEPKFKVGDYIINEDSFIVQIDGIDGNMYFYHVLDDICLLKYDITKTDKSCRLWTIQDAKEGDILASDKIILIVDHIGDFEGENIIYSWYFADSNKFYGMGPKYPDKWSIKGFHPATREQCDLLFQKMKEAGYEWDAANKELRKIEQKLIEIPFGTDSELIEETITIPNGCYAVIEDNKVILRKGKQKPTWSEEDEKMLNDIIVGLTSMEQLIFTHDVQGKTQIQGRIDWLKSLKERMKGE